ncbi:hypothetical protein BCR37DRAFT_336737, partial [Protomyces lactucae-debilis]
LLAQTSSTSSDPCNNGPYDISSASDLAAITSCTNVTGNIVISPTVGTVNLGSITVLNGDLRIINNNTGSQTLAATTSVSAPSLQSISGALVLTQLTQLNTLSMPSLTSVSTIELTTLPVLQQLGFSAVTAVSILSVIDTQLQSLQGITLTTASQINISNNRFLTAITMNNLRSVTNAILVAANSPSIAVSFTGLRTAGNFTAQGVRSVSINALNNVTGSFGVVNSSITSLELLNLTRVTGDFFVNNNAQLTALSAPALTTVSAFQVANNTQLSNITFPSLTTVAGALNVIGSFNNFTAAALTDVRGNYNVQSTSETFSCASNLKNSGVVKGNVYQCSGKVSNPTTVAASATTGSGTGASASSTRTS